MNQLPIISVKSKELQASLGVETVKSAKRKLTVFGAQLIDGEYVSVEQLSRLTEEKLQRMATSSTRHAPREDWTKGTPLEGM